VFLNTENISAFVGFSWKIEIEMHGATMKIKHNYFNIKIKSKNIYFVDPANKVHKYFLRAETCKSETE
jgi:hypothetical protein